MAPPEPERLRLPHMDAPSAKQWEFLRAWDTHLYRGFFGGRQSGKTDIGIDDDLLNAMIRYPGEPGAIFVPDYPRGIEIRERILKYVPVELRTWNGADKIWRFRAPDDAETWSRVIMRSLNHEDAPRSFTFRWAHFDEVCLMKEASYRNALACMATTGVGGKPGPHTCTSTHKGHGFAWRDFIQEPTTDHLAIESTSLDNPAFSPVYWQQVMDKHGYDSAFFKQEYRGLASAFVGQAVPQWTHELVGDWKMIRGWPMFRAWDFGWTAPTVALWIQESPDEDVTVLAERSWTETIRRVILSRLAIEIGPHQVPADVVECEFIDPSGAHGRAKEAKDPGWSADIHKRVGTKTDYTRRVSEAERLFLVREWVASKKLFVHERCTGMINALETAELDANPESDRLNERHPQVDFIDALGYYFANRFGDRLREFTVRAI